MAGYDDMDEDTLPQPPPMTTNSGQEHAGEGVATRGAVVARVAQAFSGEVSDYKMGEDVRVTSIYGDRCTIEDTRGYRCVVCVPLTKIDFSNLARAILGEQP